MLLQSTEPAEPARTPTIRRAAPEEQEALHDFTARFEKPGLPPLIDNLAFPQPLILIAVSAGRIVGLWRAEGDRRITVTHLLVVRRKCQCWFAPFEDNLS